MVSPKRSVRSLREHPRHRVGERCRHVRRVRSGALHLALFGAPARSHQAASPPEAKSGLDIPCRIPDGERLAQIQSIVDGRLLVQQRVRLPAATCFR